MSDKYTKLVKNTFIFAVGNFGSRILSFLIVPLYTYVLTTEEYGVIDLFTTTLGLIIPFTTLLIYEALLRYVLGNEVDSRNGVSNAFAVFLFGCFVSFLSILIYNSIFSEGKYCWIFVMLLILNTFTQIFSQYLRAIGKNVAFAVNGILVTMVSLTANVIFLLFLKVGITGYLYSMLCAQMVSALYIIISGKLISTISFKCVNWITIKKMLQFSIPLIPNSLMWWIMSAGDKYIINLNLGDSANGIYSLAMKVPTIVNMVYLVFSQAWQISSIEEYGKDNIKLFFENVYKIMNSLLFIVTSFIILIVKPLFLFVIGADFQPAWKYVPLLSIATIISCMSTFFNATYTLGKNTGRIFITTAIGAAVNLLVSFVLVNEYGLHGVVIGTLVGYMTVTILRAIDTHKKIGMKLDIIRTVLTILILVAQSLITVMYNGRFVYLWVTTIFFIIMLLYFKEILIIFRNLYRMSLKRIFDNIKSK